MFEAEFQVASSNGSRVHGLHMYSSSSSSSAAPPLLESSWWVLWCSSKLNLKDKGNKDAQKRRTLKSKDSHNVIFSHLLNIYQPTPHAPHLAHGMTPLLRALLWPFLQLRPDDLHFRCCLADFMGRSWPWLTWDTLRKQWGSVKLHIYSKGLNRSSHPSLTQMTNITWDHCRASEWLVAGTSRLINFEAKVLSASWDLHKVEHFRCPVSYNFPFLGCPNVRRQFV